MSSITFELKKTLKTEVLVAGGGVAGCAAALAAARSGAKTMLIENGGTLGGAAGIGIVIPLDAVKSRNGKPFGGILTEIYNETKSAGEKYCFNDSPEKLHHAVCSPHILKYILL